MNKVKKRFLLIPGILFILIPFLVFSGNRKNEAEIKVVDFKQLQPMLQQEDDTIYVVNFWATWCAPCIKEIPYFEQFGEKYRDRNVKVLMVSLDMANQLKTKLIPFIEKEKMKNEVILLDDPKFNDWIPLVDKNWTGAIPATLVYGNGFRKFYPQELTLAELEEIVQPLLAN
ncbi:TlpA disulfide reductase family protein [uncultured Proteiniphilum sp.]|uniref:TlpA disulfide reductase family protein n=1 Tax=uncultured Proteiniphilum sp. TaxID=497637 RepID=UPI00260BAEB7|nr:TlpA disulfide reductase family protein [uncultured Proteiniphilum sp.]